MELNLASGLIGGLGFAGLFHGDEMPTIGFQRGIRGVMEALKS